MRFLSNFVCKIFFMCSVNFWHQQDYNSLFKRGIGHVTSKCKRPIGHIRSLGIGMELAWNGDSGGVISLKRD